MEILAMAIMFVGGIWGAIYLVLNDHPWFGLFVLVMTASLRYPSSRKSDEADMPREIGVDSDDVSHG